VIRSHPSPLTDKASPIPSATFHKTCSLDPSSALLLFGCAPAQHTYTQGSHSRVLIALTELGFCRLFQQNLASFRISQIISMDSPSLLSPESQLLEKRGLHTQSRERQVHKRSQPCLIPLKLFAILFFFTDCCCPALSQNGLSPSSL